MVSASVIAASVAAVVTPLTNKEHALVQDLLDLDLRLVGGLSTIPAPSIPIVFKTNAADVPTTTQAISYSPASAASVVATAIIAEVHSKHPAPITIEPAQKSSAPMKFRARAEDHCVPQPLGAGPVPSEDNADEFLDLPAFSQAASGASTPQGYHQTFSNLEASNNAYGYMGYTLLPAYDANLCAQKCNAITGCNSINIYFERNPTLDPDDPSCSNPPSTTNIKCVFWGGSVSAENALNTGQWRGDFEVVIAGSNGYVKQGAATPVGYTGPVALGQAAIHAPPPCPGKPSRLLQSNVFVAPTFDIGLCATACSEQNEWAQGRKGMRPCTFFDTYILYRNQAPVGQYCAMYDETWSAQYATNFEYYSGTDHYTIGSSYTSSNITGNRPGIVCKAHQRRVIDLDNGGRTTRMTNRRPSSQPSLSHHAITLSSITQRP